MYYLCSENKGAVTAKLICVFVFAYANRWFSHDAAQVLPMCSSFNVIIPIMSHLMRKLTFCISENKDADQLCGNRDADQHLCFSYIDSTIPLLSKSEISSL